MSSVTCIAPVNIAVIKYWGKRNDELILPINDSISATLNTAQLCTKTSVMISPNFKEDRIWLNGKEEDVGTSARLQYCITETKKRSKVSKDMLDWKIHICSENNFPTAAGLASSAAGYACLTAALAKIYKVQGDISSIARGGSGSACRSILGGFVKWNMGSDPSGSDSVAQQIAPATHWPEIRILILVVNDARKKIPSSVGMKRSVETSDLIKYRVEHVLPKRVEDMRRAILQRDFGKFAELTMKDSNQMHAVCLDTYPPNVYMNNTSFAIVELVHSYNAAAGDIKVAYTFDAGPNATLYLLEEDVPRVMAAIDHVFPPFESNIQDYRRGIPIISDGQFPRDFLAKISVEKKIPGQLKYIIHTKVGDGPEYLNDSISSLLTDEGWPVKPRNTAV